jgi:hypothetical protein
MEMVSFTPRLLYSSGKSHQFIRIRVWVGPRAGLDAVEKINIIASAGNRTLIPQTSGP